MENIAKHFAGSAEIASSPTFSLEAERTSELRAHDFSIEAILAKPSKKDIHNEVCLNKSYQNLGSYHSAWTCDDAPSRYHTGQICWPPFFQVDNNAGHFGEMHFESISVWKPSRPEKRIRTKFTNKQLRRMEEQFWKRQYIIGKERESLAGELGLDDIQVKVWFQNRRIKWRKQQREMQKNVSAISNVTAVEIVETK